MSNPIEYSRLIMKRTQVSGATPSINTGDTIDNTWTDSDILTGELFYNIPDQKLYTRSGEDIVLLSQGTTGSTTTQTLSETLIAGNTTGNNWIVPNNNYGLQSTTLGITKQIQFSNNGFIMSSDDSVDKSSIYVDFNDIDITTTSRVTVSGTSSFEGIKYADDYSANFTNRSLVDKEYVDNAISTGSTPSLNEVLSVGNTTSGLNIVLGTDKIIDGVGELFSIYKSEGQWNIEANTTDREGRFILRDGVADTQIYNRTYTGVDTFTQGRLLLDSGQLQLAASSVVSGVDGPDAVLGLVGTDYPMIDISTTDVDGNLANIHLEGNLIQVSGFDNIGSGFRGIEYNDDYSANYTNRSLVDKEYVDGSTLPLSGSLDVNVSPTASTTNFAGYYAIGKSIANNKELDFLHYIPKRSSLSVPLGILPGSFVLATVPLNDSSSDFFEFRYNARKTTSPYGREVGTITAFYDVLTATVVFSRTGPVAIGDVSGLDFNVILTGATLQLTVELTGSSDWEFYTHTTTYASGFVE
jgi:hypothetical protein